MKFSKLPSADVQVMLGFSIFLLVAVITFGLVRSGILEPPEIQQPDRLTPISNDAAVDSKHAPIEVGVYIENNYLFSADDKTFYAVGQVWLNWPESVEKNRKQQGISPETWLNWINQVDRWDSKLEPVYPNPIRMADGRYHQSFRFSGQFYVDELDFRSYPFHSIHLPLVLELSETIAHGSTPHMTLVADVAGSAPGEYIDIMGYKTTGFHVTTANHDYGTHMGLKGNATQEAYHMRQIAFVTTYQQSVNATLLTLFLPLLVVMSLVMMSPILSATLWDIRLGIPPMALLTLIFLQQTYKTTLPELPYATYLDLIYNICYLINLMLFTLFLWASNRLHQAPEELRPEVTRMIDRVDLFALISLTLMLIIMSLVQWYVLPGN